MLRRGAFIGLICSFSASLYLVHLYHRTIDLDHDKTNSPFNQENLFVKLRIGSNDSAILVGRMGLYCWQNITPLTGV